MHPTLPAPDAAARAHSLRLKTHIDAAIGAAGAIGFDEFMDLALYAPGLGYYQAGQARFGSGGDFTTAPESSPLFGRCLARQVASLLAALPACAPILEFGAGSGALAASLLAELPKLGATPGEYLILEVSADLRARQRARLAGGAGSPVRWLNELPKPPWTGVVIANEVLDALPVRRFRIDEQGAPRELAVAMRAGGFAWVERAADAELRAAVRAIESARGAALPCGYVSEASLRLGPWCASVGEFLTKGAVLLIDYGYPAREYYHTERSAGTLVCHYRHRVHDDPFFWVGLQDLSCSVDFSALATAAQASGFAIAGFGSQANFLIGCGIERVLGEIGAYDSVAYVGAAAETKRLILPGEMGERFKVLGLTRNLDGARWPGFEFINHRDRL